MARAGTLRVSDLSVAMALRGSRGGIMFRHVLIPTDGTESSQKAVIGGNALAEAIDARGPPPLASPPLPLLSTTPLMVIKTREQKIKKAAAPGRGNTSLAGESAPLSGAP